MAGERAPRALARRATQPRPPLVDVAAPAVVWLYVVLLFQPFEQVVGLPGSASGVLLPAVGVAVLAITPSDRLARIPISLALWALVTWGVLSVLWSEVPAFTQYQTRSQLLPLLVLSLVVGTMAPRRLATTAVAIFITIGLCSLVTSLILPTGRAAVGIDGVAQVGFRGGFIHKNLLGIFLVCGLCAILPFARGRARPWAIALFLTLIVGTRSATTAGGLFGVLFVWGWMAAIAYQRTPRERQFLQVISVASAVVGILIVLGLLPTILDLYDKDLTFSGRTEIWAESLETIGDRPVQGYGLGGVWSDPGAPVTAELHRRIGFEAAHTHNSALELLLEGGVVGLALTTLLLVQTGRLALACLREPTTARYGQWGVLTLLAVVIMGLAEPLWGGPYLGLVVVVWVTLARVRSDLRRSAASDRGLPRQGVGAVLTQDPPR